MSVMLLGFVSAFWLGILTSISPCPLATNIAAVSFLAKKVVHPKAVFLSGIFYSLGRMSTYAIVGFLIIKSIFSIPITANFLQKYMNKLLGPVLLISGLFLLDVLKFNLPGLGISKEKHESLVNSGIGGAFILGILFALSFCPVSAALFFGSLIPLSLSNKFGVVFPFIYGIATGLPVLVFALFTALGVKAIGGWFNKVSRMELYARKITGLIFAGAGLYYVFVYYR